jgi:type IV pilus assembly protein PilA
MRNASHRLSHAASRGFTLVEIMVVVVIIGLLAALALPAFQRSQRASQNSRAINDFRIFAQAFEVYNSQNGGWPPNAGAGVVPTGMSKDFKEDTWKAPATSIGGRWNWDVNRAEFLAGVSISGATVTDEQLLEIDAKLDDGNLSTGFFQKISSSPARVSYILEFNP